MSELRVLGHPIAAVTMDEAASRVLAYARESTPRLVVTLNPEIVVQARAQAAVHRAIERADLVVADGVGILWAARRAGVRLPERVPGVELTERILQLGGGDLRVYLLGARPGVAAKAAEAASTRFGTNVVGVHHGFFRRPADTPRIIEEVRRADPDLLLAGLGDGQERFLAEHLDDLGVPVSMGVGGTIDVLAGEAKRTPAWTRRAGLEWAWRVGGDPKRWHRIPRLVRFAAMVLAGAGNGRQREFRR